MLSRWQRARDCFEGSDAVKAQGVKYLPFLDSHKKFNAGGTEKYEEYKMRALFYNATGRTIEGMAGALFQTSPRIEAPSAIEEHMEDVTLTGLSAELFGLTVIKELLLTGRYGALVDMPREDGAALNLARPYWVGYKAEDIISWRTYREAGNEVLSRVVLFELVEEQDPKDPFIVSDFEQYRVLELVEKKCVESIWRKLPGSDHYEQIDQIIPVRRGEPLPFIPFTFFGPTSPSVGVQKPPIDDLVIVNLSHYRTLADLEHGRHFTAMPTPWVAGAIGLKAGEALSIGSGTAWSLEKDGRAGMLEFSGAGLGHLADAEREKRKMMATLGARLLEDQAGVAETATAVSMRHAGETATLRTIAQSAETGLSQVLRTHAWWLGTEPTPDLLREVHYELNKEFFTIRLDPQELQGLVTALQAETISYATFYAQLQRGEIARPGVSAEEEQAAILERSQMLAGLQQPLPGEVPPGEEGFPPEEGAGEQPGDKAVEAGDWWKIVQRKKKFILIDVETGEEIGSFPSQREAKAAVKQIEEQEG